MVRKSLFSLFFLPLLALLAACGATPGGWSSVLSYEIDPLFREYYDLLGGESTMRAAISPKFSDSNGIEYQYVANGLMVYNPFAAPSERFSLAPLGLEFGVEEVAEGGDRHEIFLNFKPLYRQIGGARTCGRPLSPVEPAPEGQALIDGVVIIQYFERCGFYQTENDPPDVSHLMPYGSWKCVTTNCLKLDDEVIGIPIKGEGGCNILVEAIQRLDSSFLGPVVKPAYTAPDGRCEQAYENVIVYEDSSRPGGIALRPLYTLLKYPQGSLEPPSADPEMDFFAVDGDLGFNVYRRFWEYIEQHGGFEFIGKPTTQFSELSDAVFRQCFENVCLNYFPNEEASLQIQPMDLGRVYSNRQEAQVNEFSGVRLTVWEQKPVMAPGQTQMLNALVVDRGDPVENVELVATVYMSDGSKPMYDFSLTDSSGMAEVEFGPIDASPGTVIRYEVCIIHMDGIDEPCLSDSFLIWQEYQ